MGAIVGIDLGSFRCRTALFRDGTAELFANRFSERMPVLVQRRADDGVGCGLPDPAVQFRSLKQKAGSEDTLHGAAGVQSVGHALCDVFRAVLADSVTAAGEKISGAVLAVPGFYPERPRAVLREAALNAGFPAVRLMDESLAALRGRAKPVEGANLLVYGWGAGVFSATVVRLGGGRPRVLCAEGNRVLGGHDLDAALISLLLARCGQQPREDSWVDAMLRLKSLAEQLKIGLTRREEEELDCNLTEFFGQGGTLRLGIARAEFERSIRPAVETTVALARKAVQEAGMSAGAVDRVLLVGGTTRIPLVERLIGEAFPAARLRASDGDIACGAAAYGASLEPGEWARKEQEREEPPAAQVAGPPPERDGDEWAAMFAPARDAGAMWRRGEKAKAAEVFAGMLQQGQSLLATLYQQLGSEASFNGRHDDAIAWLEKALRLDREDQRILHAYHETLNQKAKALYKSGDLARARETIRVALKINPNCPNCMNLAAQIDQVLRGGFSAGAQQGRKKRRR